MIQHEMSVSYLSDAQPHIIWKHIDGPLLCCRDGSMHWLTWRERFAMWLGLLSIEQLEARVMR